MSKDEYYKSFWVSLELYRASLSLTKSPILKTMFFSLPKRENQKMAIALFRVRPFALMSMLLVAMCSLSDCYDPMDPNGNITVTFDIVHWTPDGYVARVTIQNYYQYRHVDKPGWKLGWTWAKVEVIWSMRGAFATEGGNCTSFKDETPHSCKKDPVIVDLMPEALPENKSEDCCHSGVLYSSAINPSMSFSTFEMKVGNLEGNTSGHAPKNLTLMAPGPGYTCGPVLDAKPTVTLHIGGRRQVPVFRTWKSICTYSSFLANRIPTCCVSLSAFYNPTITSCPLCSCGCREADKKTQTCIRDAYPASSDVTEKLDIVQCTDHMCPVQVHWHIKSNYMQYWRIKLTISNYNYKRNYSNWNVLVQHPGFNQNATTYSFNSTLLPTVGFKDEVALFWGLKYYNEELLQAVEDNLGSVTTEILLPKNPNTFTFSNGWAFPRRIYFNGENCEMPLPDTFPTLPNGSSKQRPLCCLLFLFITFSFKILFASH